MTQSMLNRWPIDPAIVILSLGVITLLLLIMTIICVVQLNRLYRRYDRFMRGRDAESLENIIVEEIEEIKELRAQDRSNKDVMKTLTRGVKSSYQKFGMVKYNAFKGMGGNLSFAFALLDMNNTGFILNSVHSREGCYLYIKMVEKGETDIALGSEEKEALEQALGY
ncbi:MAG: DUF4446 family protein [Hungatella sp.]|nr:DUF4446 family protein [Hungatella sp.]